MSPTLREMMTERRDTGFPCFCCKTFIPPAEVPCSGGLCSTCNEGDCPHCNAEDEWDDL
jgi:hypothetical protein